jgi:hypothetical protein
MAKVAFRQADLQRALRASKAEGVPVEIRIEPTGALVVSVIDRPQALALPAEEDGNFWDTFDATDG